MDKVKQLKNMLNSRDDINSLLKIIIRMGVGGIFIVTLMVIWSYLILKVAIPNVIEIPESNTGTTIDGDPISNTNPFDIFCAAQVNSRAPEDSAILGETCSQSDITDGNTDYHCSDVPPDLAEDVCQLSETYDNTRSWCDRNGLPAFTSIDTTTPRIKRHCCIATPHYNYMSTFIYLLVTIPIIYMLIDKLFNKFIFVDREGGDINQFYKLFDTVFGGKVSSIVVIVLICYYVLFPILRFIFVSYRCESVTGSSDSNCQKACVDDNDCVSINNSSCSTCISNLCSESIFSDNADVHNTSDLQMSVCGINSIIDDLQEQEIDDIYLNYVSQEVSLSSIQEKRTAIIDHLTANPSDKEKITSYYYKFYPRQEININDTSTPLRIRIPNPSVVGYDYLLNNYIQLNTTTCSDSTTETMCNRNNCTWNGTSCIDTVCTDVPDTLCNSNHNCIWSNASNSCGNSACFNDQYDMPIVPSRNSTQNISDDLHLHNKVYRTGIDIDTTTNRFPDNLYPCNDVVIANNLKIVAQNDISSDKSIDSMDTWLDHFELKRIECADKMGQCYVENYICENSAATPIPLKNLQDVNAEGYSIGEIGSDLACQMAMYPCSNVDTACTTLEEDNKGYIVEKSEGGICKNVVWNVNIWEEPTDGTTYDLPETKKCIPNSTTVDATRFTGARVANWVTTNVVPTTQCKSVNRLPRSNIDSGTSPSLINNYFRWKAVSSSDNMLCSEWSNTCPTNKVLKNNTSYRPGETASVVCCGDVIPADGVNLYVTGPD